MLPSKTPIKQAFPVEIPPIEICDIGAMSEGDDRYTGLLAQGLARATGFEPNPIERAKLEARGDTRRQYLPAFVGKGGPAVFHLARYPGCSSLYEPDPEIINMFTGIGATLPHGNFAIVRTEPVQTTRLDDVPGLPPCDYLKLDIQGAELDALVGGDKVLANVLVLESEVEFVPLYKRQPLFADIHCHLRQRGFVLHKFIDIAGRAFAPFALDNNPALPMSQVLWADAIFVRDVFQLSVYSDPQLLKAAVILYECYNSYDLVYHLLREYDRRRGATLANTFATSLRTMPSLSLLYMNQKLE